MKTKKEKVKALLDKLETIQNKKNSALPISDELTTNLINEEMASVTSKLKDNVIIRSLEKINSDLKSFKKDFNLEPVIDLIKEVADEVETNQQEYNSEFKTKLQELTNTIQKVKKESGDDTESKISPLLEDLKTFKKEYQDKQTEYSKEKETIQQIISSFESKLNTISVELSTRSEGMSGAITEMNIGTEKSFTDVEKKISLLRQDILNRLANLPQGGGNMNRQIKVEGTDVLTKYTDINLKAGSGISLTTANNQTNKNVDITITSIADTSVTLADVSASSTTTPQSLYTMSAGIPVEFKTSGGTHLLYLDETNARVGIGTDSPSVPLHVAYSNSGNVAAIINNTSATGYGTLLRGGATDGTTYALAVQNQGSTDLMRITGDGKVGIGTVVPIAKLHIYSIGGVNSGLLTESTSAVSYATTDWKNSSGDLTQMLASGASFSNGMILSRQANFNTAAPNGISLLAYDSSGFITFGTGGLSLSNERMRITAAGNIGIGDVTPSSKLTIYDSSSVTVAMKTASSGAYGFTYGIPSATNAELWNYDAGYLRFATNNTEVARMYGTGILNVVTKLTIGVGVGAGIGTASLMVYNANGGDVIGAIIRGYSSQTVNLTEWQNSSGTVLANVTASGNISGEIITSNSSSTFSFKAADTGMFYFNTRGGLRAPSNGVFTLLDTAETSFGRLQFGGTSSSFPSLKRNSVDIQARLADDSAFTNIEVDQIATNNGTFLASSVNLTDGAAAATGTLTNAPAAGNPTKWIPIDDNGTTRYIPCW